MAGKKKKASLRSTPLWDHQRQAVATIRKYLAAAQGTANMGAALVHMPTGSGKTGVIAVASHFLKVGCVLILCPRVALRDQLEREVEGRFFEKLGLDASSLSKKVLNVKSGRLELKPETYADTILVMTIQMLHSILNRAGADAEALKKHVDLVIVDEGHYEPALSWREAIRAIQKPKVIFTATPFRNDLKLFDIDFDHAFSYTFHQAVKDKVIRDISIEVREPPSSLARFVDEVISFYDHKVVQGIRGDKPRTIIRCESQATIRQIGRALEVAGKSYVLIHENFADDDPARPRERRTVPDPNLEGAIFWVHQFKLLEGIDDSRFRLLALYEELRTTRSFVQQVGRVLRNPERRSGALAYALDHTGGRQKELWDDFMRFDGLIDKEGVSPADLGSKLKRSLQDAQPELIYLDGRFRTPFLLSDFDPTDELYLPLTVNVFQQKVGSDIARLAQAMRREYEDADRVVQEVPTDADTRVFAYLAFRNSPLLRSKSFVENRLGVTILRQVGKYLCYFDSGSGLPASLDDHTRRVSSAELRKLFGRSSGTYLTEVGLQNAILGPRVVRSRTLSAAQIASIVPAFDDHSFVCRTARGRVGNGHRGPVRRYIGFERGRVTDSADGRATFGEYMLWLDGIAQVLEKRAGTLADFERYALPASLPDDPDPVNILLDLAEVQDKFLTGQVQGVIAGQAMDIEDACSAIANGSFSMQANGKSCDVSIEFNAKTNRYKLGSPDLEELFHTQDEGLKRGVISYLNTNQSFRVVPRSEGSFYTLGEFYSPILRFGRGYRDGQFGLLRILHPSLAVAPIGSEKGKACLPDGSGWDPDSLFAMIDGLGKGYDSGLEKLFGEFDIAVCDDMGTEAADFIMADTGERRVVFIHAKGNGGRASKYAASPLQEVCSQATKNLKYFSRYGSDAPNKTRTWDTQPWSAPGVTGEVTHRIRRSPPSVGTGREVWKEIRSIIRDPLADLEVWLFLGGLLSKSAFGRQLRATRPAPEAKQAAYLLFSTMNDVASVGAKLRVICSP